MDHSPVPEPFEQPAASRYVLGHQIAKGGMGSILEAHDTWLSRSVAVKRMLTENEMESDRSRFQREALVLGRLAHPNIVPIHDFGVDEGGTPFYAMKLVRGQTLESILRALREPKSTKEKSPYTLERLLTIFQKICDAMAFAHRQGIIHRDLKPDNIMVGEFGEVQVMDWGLAKDLHGTLPAVSNEPRNSSAGADLVLGDTLSGDIMGSPQYMAPEQAEGRVADQDETTDVFLLGGILYAILTLQPPLQGSNFKELLNKAITADIVPPTRLTTIRPGHKTTAAQPPALRNTDKFTHCPGGRIPLALSAVAMKALSGRKKNRYASVSDLAAEVEAYQNGFATRAENASAFRLISLFVSRHRAFATSLFLILAVGGVLGTKATLEGIRAERALADLKASAPSMLKLAESESDSQRFTDALRDLDAALSLDPSLNDARWLRGWVLLALERWSEATAALRLARQHDPENAEFAQILPAVEMVATVTVGNPWESDAAREILHHFQAIGAIGPSLAFSTKLRLSSEERRQLVEKRLGVVLGHGNFAQGVDQDGLVWVWPKNSLLRSLEPFRGLPLDSLNLLGAPIADLEPLRDMPLKRLDISATKVADLSLLRGLPLTKLMCNNTPVADLSPLAGMSLEILHFGQSKVIDLSPLARMPLAELVADWNRISSVEALRGMPLVRATLGNSQIADFSPLQGAPVEFLNILATRVSDLSFVKGMPLRYLQVSRTPVQNIAPLRGLPLESVFLEATGIDDLSPLRHLPIKTLDIRGCRN